MVTSNKESGSFNIAATMDDAERSRKWLVMQDDECVGEYESRKDALAAASKRFGRVPVIACSVDDQPTIIRPMFRECPEDFPLFVSAHSTVECSPGIALNRVILDTTEGGQPYRAILGRDILKAFTMTHDGRQELSA